MSYFIMTYKNASDFTKDYIHEMFMSAECNEVTLDDPSFDGIVVRPIYDHGGEGQGSDAEMVREVVYPNGKKELIRVTGYYASYAGFDWCFNDMHECEAKQKMVTYYEPIFKSGNNE